MAKGRGNGKSKGTITQKEFVAFLGDLDDNKVDCRTLYHAWRVESVYKAGATTVRITRCGRCNTMKRQEFFGSDLKVKATQYRYPRGYTMPGIGRHRRSEFLKESFQRYEVEVVAELPTLAEID